MHELKPGRDYTGNCVVFFCFDELGKLLMQKRSERARDEKGRWDCGAGGIEVHERFEDTLAKEIMEEYNCTIIRSEFLGSRDVHREDEIGPTHWITQDFKVYVDTTNFRNNEPHKFDDVGRFDLDNLPTPLHSQLQGAIDKYRDRL